MTLLPPIQALPLLLPITTTTDCVVLPGISPAVSPSRATILKRQPRRRYGPINFETSGSELRLSIVRISNRFNTTCPSRLSRPITLTNDRRSSRRLRRNAMVSLWYQVSPGRSRRGPLRSAVNLLYGHILSSCVRGHSRCSLSSSH